MSLQVDRLQTVEQIREFVSTSREVSFRNADRASAYAFFQRTLVGVGYSSLGRADKGAVRAYLEKVTGLSRSQVTRLIPQYRDTGRIVDRPGRPANAFAGRYTKADIGPPAEVDELLGQMCGHSTRAVMRRMLEEFGDERFECLAYISHGHVYKPAQVEPRAGGAAPRFTRLGPSRFRSPSAASPSLRVGRAFCGSTRCGVSVVRCRPS